MPHVTLFWLLLGACTAHGAVAGAPGADNPGVRCWQVLPEALVEPLVNRVIVKIGTAAQSELTGYFFAESRLSRGRRARVAEFAAPSSGAATGAAAGEAPRRLDFDDIELHLIDYGWFADRTLVDPAAWCDQLVVRTPAECPGSAADIHNLYVAYLRNRQGLCGGPVDWTAPDSAPGAVRRLAEIVAAPAYFAALERWQENSPEDSFRVTEGFFTLLYLDYLKEAFDHRQIDLAYREFLLRRRDLRERYPGLETVRLQLGRLKDLGLIE